VTLSPLLRKLALTVHLTSSVGWIGAVIAYLALGIAAVTSGDTQTIRAAWTGMELTGWWVIVPLAIAALLTGLVMSLGTRWGLFRHYWVLISLGLTSLCTFVLLVHMPSVSAMASVARTADGAELRALAGDLFHPGAGLVLLLLITGLNVYKPAGLTPCGWRKQREERRALRASFSSSQTASEPARPRVLHMRPVSPLRAFGTRAASFTFHFAEMWFAMLLGMAVFMIAAVTLAAQGNPILSVPTSIGFQVGMSLFMVAPMAAWMRFQGCDWRACGELSIAMLLSTGAVVAFGAFGLRDVELWVSSNQHMLMLLGMLAVMLYRRERYTRGYSFGRWTGASRPRQEVNI
jgi:hypothetical protein